MKKFVVLLAVAAALVAVGIGAAAGGPAAGSAVAGTNRAIGDDESTAPDETSVFQRVVAFSSASVAAIPELGELLLIGAGLVGVATITRRRMKSKRKTPMPA